VTILLTNDDGIQAQGLTALFRELKKIGRVVVVAPDSQRSSVGHGITLGRPIRVKKMRTSAGIHGVGLSGTPADCVKFALTKVLKRKPTIVVSGINLGPNDGCSVFYSGTVAAAREASLYGITAIAFSLDTFVNPDYRYAAKFAAKLVADVARTGLAAGTFLNVNIPNVPEEEICGVKFTRQSTVPFHTRFTAATKKPSASFWLSCDMLLQKKDLTCDTTALASRFITITPIHNDLTDHKTLKVLRKKGL